MSYGKEILGVLKSMANAWGTFISTRQEAYERKNDIKKNKAIQAAETYIRINEGEFIHEKDPKKKSKMRKRLIYYKEKFYKFN